MQAINVQKIDAAVLKLAQLRQKFSAKARKV